MFWALILPMFHPLMGPYGLGSEPDLQSVTQRGKGDPSSPCFRDVPSRGSPSTSLLVALKETPEEALENSFFSSWWQLDLGISSKPGNVVLCLVVLVVSSVRSLQGLCKHSP